jgi:hypothetical protein
MLDPAGGFFLRRELQEAYKRLGLRNGELLRVAEEAGLEIFLTTPKNICYQQNLTDRTITIVVLGNRDRPRTKRD